MRLYPGEECGVFAVCGHPNAVTLSTYGLYALQHRGEESAGIAASDGKHPFRIHRGMGLVSQVFDSAALASLSGSMAIGHVRYSTTGSSNLMNAQPIAVVCSQGELALAHNGDIVNASELRARLENRGSIFQTTTDSEVILHLMAQRVGKPVEEAFLWALDQTEGAYALVLMAKDKILAARDPQGFRPLSLGRLDDGYILSSETCAFDLLHVQFLRDIAPGEVISIDGDGVHVLRAPRPIETAAFCIFEYVYFARPDSTIHGINVSQARIQMGRELARLYPVEADLVIPVPDSGNYAALGFSEESGIPFNFAFVRNHYIGRTFLQPTQLIRDFNVRIKLNLVQESVRGKRVVVVDDSIVRGTTARARVANLREAGASEVHIRVSCPPHRFACHYGIDFPDPGSLLANQLTLERIQSYLNADSIGYLNIDGLLRACGSPESSMGFCTACFTGRYPVAFRRGLHKEILERNQLTPLAAK
ncbi:amidophosphoribosyltransferase [Methylacidimicrobium cyclopophantes]|uniref:amidophosphoribosyltransferase n=1 Tax=Methylacidimicrobium cyclopophantes TaxID=1041766 RepID=UPI0011588841|nr:amidophosphoribosyltransferase [Methylacidimicrobium cyclopophantes]